MKSTQFTIKSMPLTFAIVTILAYGLLVTQTGFYWDDWPFAWIAKFLGPKEFFPAFASVRPFLGPIFFVTTSLIPPVPLYWQIFALIIRFISGLSAWFALNQIWPYHKRQTLVTSLLFLVFPGYSQHWVAFTHINQEWIPFIFYLLSFGFTARALRNKHVIARKSDALTMLAPDAHLPGLLTCTARRRKCSRSRGVPGSAGEQSPKDDGLATGKKHPHNDRLNTIYALLLLAAGVFPTEYFLGLEPLRFLFIWVIVSEDVNGFWQRFRQALEYWWPYWVIWLGNVAWLAYFYTSGLYGSYDVEVVKEPMTLIHFFSAIGEAIWKGGFYIWAQVLVLISKVITAPTSLFTLALISITFAFLFFYLRGLDLSEGQPKLFAISATFIGLAGILLGRLPSFAAGLPLTLQSSYDRFMISMMLGGSLFVAGLIELTIRNSRIKTYTFALLIALGVGQQFFNANIFRRDWAKQQEIYWQLAWRIPAMKPNTAFLTDQLPIDYETDLSFTAPINWMYAPAYTHSNLPYALIYTEKRLGGGTLSSFQNNIEINMSLRTVAFHGSTSQVIVIYMPQNGCLRVLDPAKDDQITYARQSQFLVDAISLSDPSNIIVATDQTARLPFFLEPDHTWCYYYEKAELTRKTSDWNQVIDLINEAISLGYKPEDSFEWLTYIEAQALTGNVETAQKISTDAFAQDQSIRKGLCVVWKRVQAGYPAGDVLRARVNQISSNFQCVR